MDKPKIKLKHIEIYIIVFVLAVGGAIAAFIIAFQNIKKQNNVAKYYVIEQQQIEEVPSYGEDFYFEYYFDGESYENEQMKSTLSEFYSKELAKLYAQFDSNNVYNQYASIARLNKNPNQEVEFDEFTYSVIKDAYYKTTNSTNYSIFAEPLEYYWQPYFMMTEKDKKDLDPLLNEGKKAVLDSLCTYLNDRDSVDLSFLENNKIKLTVSDTYKSFLLDNGLENNIVGLNVLKTAYISKYISETLTRFNWTNGYLYTNDGKVIQLSTNHSTLNYYYYAFTNSESGLVVLDKPAQITIKPYSFMISNKRFSNSVVSKAYYFELNGEKQFRNLHLDIDTGMPHNEIASINVFGNGNDDILELSFINNELSKCNSLDAIKDYLNAKNLNELKILVGLNSKEKNIYYLNAIKDYVLLSEELDYNLIKFN